MTAWWTVGRPEESHLLWLQSHEYSSIPVGMCRITQLSSQECDSHAWGENLTIAEPCSDGGLFPPGGDRVSQPCHETWGHRDSSVTATAMASLPATTPERALEADLLHWVLSSTWGQLNLCAGSGFLPERRKPVLSTLGLFPIFTSRALSLCVLWWIPKWYLVFIGYFWSPVFPLVLLDCGDGSHHVWSWILAMSLTLCQIKGQG